MNCKKCNTQITELDLYCPGCGEPVEGSTVSVGVEGSVSDGYRGIIGKAISSPLFIVYAAFASVFALLNLVGAFMTSGIGMLLMLAVAATAVVSCVFAWKMWASKGAVKGKEIKLLAVHPMAMKIVAALECIFAGIISFFALIFSLIAGLITIGAAEVADIVDEALASANLEADVIAQIQQILDSGLVVAIAGIVCVIVVMLVSISGVRLFGKIAKYFGTLSASYEDGMYDEKTKVPCVSLWIFGVVFAIAGLILLSSEAVFALQCIAMAGTLIAQALLFKSLHKAMNEYASTPRVELPGYVAETVEEAVAKEEETVEEVVAKEEETVEETAEVAVEETCDVEEASTEETVECAVEESCETEDGTKEEELSENTCAVSSDTE